MSEDWSSIRQSLLHRDKARAFIAFAETKGYYAQYTMSELFRLYKVGTSKNPMLFYSRFGKTHITIPGEAYELVREFLGPPRNRRRRGRRKARPVASLEDHYLAEEGV